MCQRLHSPPSLVDDVEPIELEVVVLVEPRTDEVEESQAGASRECDGGNGLPILSGSLVRAQSVRLVQSLLVCLRFATIPLFASTSAARIGLWRQAIRSTSRIV